MHLTTATWPRQKNTDQSFTEYGEKFYFKGSCVSKLVYLFFHDAIAGF